MESSEQSVTDYFLYVKNVLGVKTLQSSSIQNLVRERLQNPLQAVESQGSVLECDLLFLNIRTQLDHSIFAGEAKALADKMIQAMRLGARVVQILEADFSEGLAREIRAPKVLQEYSQKVKSPFVVLFSSTPGEQGVIRNLGAQKYLETFSPGYLMNHPQAKKVAWLDLQKVMRELGVL
jgi:hypothetical protein